MMRRNIKSICRFLLSAAATVVLTVLAFRLVRQNDIMAPRLEAHNVEPLPPQTQHLLANNAGANAPEKIDWHDYKQIERDALRKGIGEQGKPANLSPDEYELKEALYKVNGFNALLSDKIALDRALPDIRHKGCKSKKYLKKLPTVSIIVPFHNEHWSTLLRTVISAINKSPPELLREIILVDDFSSKEHCKEKLDKYVAENLPKVKVIHLPERSGLIRARLAGARIATSDVLIFLDSHTEANVNWLPPLLEPIAEDYRTCVCPFIDVIAYETFEYRAQDEGARGAFDWEFFYKRLPLLPEDLKHPTEPFKSPVMAGGLFAISSKFFWELGGYDEGLEIWGGEQYELSFKIWQCGGQMVDAPCSRVGHIYRKFAPFPNPGKGDFVGRNYRRVAEVWMDEYKEYLYKRRPHYRNINPGDLSKQKELRERLHCKPFKWFMEEIAFDLPKKYPPIEPPDFAYGEIRSVAAPELCVDTDFAGTEKPFGLKECVRDRKNTKGQQNFTLTWHKDIRPSGRTVCWDVSSTESKAPVTLYGCHGSKGNQLWRYDPYEYVFNQRHMVPFRENKWESKVPLLSRDAVNVIRVHWKFEKAYGKETPAGAHSSRGAKKKTSFSFFGWSVRQSTSAGDDTPLDSSLSACTSSGQSNVDENESLHVASSSTQQFQSSMRRYVDVIRPIPPPEKRALDIQLLKMICKEYHPFSIVDDEEFRKFVQLLNKNYSLPSRKTITNSLLPTVYNEILGKIETGLPDAQAICLTCDGWTSINNVSFYALTAHYFDRSTRLRTCLIECSEFSSWVNGVLDKFSIRNKICAIVIDNAASMKAAVADLNIRYISCFAHSLNLIVKDAISSSVNEIVDKAKSIVQHFKQSSSALAKVHEMQSSLNKDHLKLKQDVPTRWNSTYDMLDRLIKNKEPLVSAMALLGLQQPFIYEEREWKVVDHVVKILAVFNDVTKEVSAETTVSLSETTILSRIMSRKVKRYLESNQDIPECVSKLGQQLKRFGNLESNELISHCIILDPRFKKQGFGDECKYRLAHQTLVGKVRAAVESNKKTERLRFQQVGLQPAQSLSSLWQEFDATMYQLQAKQDPTAEAIVEIDKYLNEPHLPRTSDPLSWWEMRKHTYPNLYPDVLKRLCIPATSVPCERIFSKAGQICTEKRSRLTSDKISKILFINNNLHLI